MKWTQNRLRSGSTSAERNVKQQHNGELAPTILRKVGRGIM